MRAEGAGKLGQLRVARAAGSAGTGERLLDAFQQGKVGSVLLVEGTADVTLKAHRNVSIPAFQQHLSRPLGEFH
jgi:hypothetical protein